MKRELSELAQILEIFMAQMNNHQRTFPAEKTLNNQIDTITLVDVSQLLSQATIALGQWGCNKVFIVLDIVY